MLNASRRRCCLHQHDKDYIETYLLCSTPHGVVAVCTPAAGGTRTPRPVLNASRRRCCLHGRLRLRRGRRAVVLNASRRRCCLHASEVKRWSSGRLCSTPHGVVAVCTGCVMTAPAELWRAQRLTASLLSAPREAGDRRDRRRGVLNASRRRCCLHPVNVSCSSARLSLCSTPHGVVAVCTRSKTPLIPQQGCAQRLTASLLSARGEVREDVCAACVLNASRRRCCLHA